MKRFKLLLIAGVLSAAVLSCETSGQEDDIESSITEIEVTAIRTVYGLGETIDPASIEVTATSDSGAGPFAITAAHLNPKTAPETAQTGFTITVTVNGHQDTFAINVFPVVSKSIGGSYAGRDNLDEAFNKADDEDTIIIYADQTIENDTNPEGMTITLQGYGAERKITHTAGAAMFALSGANTRLRLADKITLDGQKASNSAPLVRITNNAALFMEDGSKITGGKIISSGGVAGVHVGQYGIFTMSGGTISENEGGTGDYGGVYVGQLGTFTMSGGTIRKNKGGLSGGGVSIVEGTFTMRGGTISENETNQNGGGIFVGYFGTFTYNAGTFTGNTATGGGNAVYKYDNGVINGDGGVNVGTGGVGFDVFPPQ